MKSKTTQDIISYNDTIPDDARFDDVHEKYLELEWYKVEDVRKIGLKLEKWFNDWYNYSWHNKSSAAAQEIKRVKKLIGELK